MLRMRNSEEHSAPIELPKASPLIFVVSGPSGVGKDSVVGQLKQRRPELHYTITATTRAPRAGEMDGVHYHFRTDEQFKALLGDGGLFEWAEVYGHYYGVPKFELQDAVAKNQDVVVKVDVQGAATIKRLVPQASLVFIAPYSLGELLQRHFRRRTESGWDLNIRLETARTEMEAMSSFDYVIVNKQGELVRAVATLEAIVTAEKSRVKPHTVSFASV